MSDAVSSDGEDGALRFLKTTKSRADLCIALDVLMEFKDCENAGEWMMTPFAAWAKLEQLQDYLCLLTSRDVDKVDDQTAKDYLASL